MCIRDSMIGVEKSDLYEEGFTDDDMKYMVGWGESCDGVVPERYLKTENIITSVACLLYTSFPGCSADPFPIPDACAGDRTLKRTEHQLLSLDDIESDPEEAENLLQGGGNVCHTVSYTHLDVYKRQLLHSRNSKAWQSSAGLFLCIQYTALYSHLLGCDRVCRYSFG